MQQFLDAYLHLEKDLTQTHIAETKAELGSFLRAFKVVDDVMQPYLQQEAPSYNIFKLLRIGHYETKVHSPFLANLLDPRGSHQQGDHFFKAFMTEVAQRPAWLEGLNTTHKVQVILEQGSEKGFIDILIFGEQQGKPFGIVIENKIYAGDQEKQMERYYAYLRDVKNLPPDRLLLIYLTLDGKRPSIPYSISKESFKQLRDSKPSRILLRSYRKDIRKWLQKTNKEIPSEKVRFTIQQYLDTLKHL